MSPEAILGGATNIRGGPPMKARCRVRPRSSPLALPPEQEQASRAAVVPRSQSVTMHALCRGCQPCLRRPCMQPRFVHLLRHREQPKGGRGLVSTAVLQ